MKYIAGNTVQGKRRTKSYKIHKVEQVPEEEWIRVENTHEPIIDKQTFEKAQKLAAQDTRVEKKTNQLSTWAGMLKCMDCKRAMNKKSSTNKTGKTYEYYICSTYRKKSNKLCTKHTIKIEQLEKAVLQAINLHISLLIDIEKLFEKLDNCSLKKEKEQISKNMIIVKQKEISKIENFKKTLYQDWKNEDLTREEYLTYKKSYDEDLERLKQNIENLKKEEGKKSQNAIKNKWLETLKKQKKIEKLSRDIILELIECIYVHENKEITIKFKFEDEFSGIIEKKEAMA